VRKISVIDSSISYNAENKTAISVRDGVLEYLGVEIGELPPNKIFTVYRSPSTIANAASSMRGIPLTDEHIDPGEPIPDGVPIGTVNHAEMIDFFDSSTESKLAVMNIVEVKDDFLDMLASGKRELSLGYNADLVPHDKYDFEQRNIIPHHLAVVMSGRCGSSCRFIDRKPSEEKAMPKKTKPAIAKAFCDEDGAVSLEQVMEIAMSLPEAIKKVPVDRLQEIMPALNEIIGYAASNGVEMESEGEQEVTDEETESKPAEEEKEKVPVTDSKEFIDALKKATDSAIKLHSEVVDKAKNFVDDSYSFAGKSTSQIMRDALATEHGSTKFNDSELPVAFKLLKKTANYKQFGDSVNGGLEARVQENLKG